MTFEEYAEKARSFRMESIQNNLSYSALGLNGEAGEVADKVKKILRDHPEDKDAARMEIAKELGDVLWYLVAVADDLGIPLHVIAQSNIDKLQSRKDRDAITGSGDNR